MPGLLIGQGVITSHMLQQPLSRAPGLFDQGELAMSNETLHLVLIIESGVDGLLDEQRPGRLPTLDQKTINRVLTLTTQYVPEEATQWSERLMAEHAGVMPYQVRKIWKAADRQPYRLKTFKISNNPDFAEKVVDIVGLYMNPPSNAVVLSVDEKTQIQVLACAKLIVSIRKGKTCISSSTITVRIKCARSASGWKVDLTFASTSPQPVHPG